MSRWLIELSGEAFDVEEFPYWFPNGDTAYAFEENAKTYLTGPLFAALDDLSKVNEAAQLLINEYFAVIRLLESNAVKPTIGLIIHEADDGTRQRYQLAAGTASGRSKTRFVSSASDDRGAIRQTQAQELLAASRSNRSLQIATSLLAIDSPTWPHLYRCLEEVEHFLGTTVSNQGLCTDNERERFTRTANSAEASGIDSRHRLGRFDPPAHPMTLREARTFIDQLLHSTLCAVAHTPRPSQ